MTKWILSLLLFAMPAQTMIYESGLGGPPPSPAAFFDNFDRSTLGTDWIVATGTWSIALSDDLAQTDLTANQNRRIYYAAGQTTTNDQYAMFQIASSDAFTSGFIFRAAAAADGQHYQVHLPAGSTIWKWERHDGTGSFAELVGTCDGGVFTGLGQWMMATVEGVGITTVVSVWLTATSTDPGPFGTWGPPRCTITADPLTPVDNGKTVGLRVYQSNSSVAAKYDNWSAGDL